MSHRNSFHIIGAISNSVAARFVNWIADFAAEPAAGTGPKIANIYLASDGGDVDAAFIIIDYANLFMASGAFAEIHTHAVGACSSAAFDVWLVGTRRFVSEHAICVFHNATGSNVKPALFEARAVRWLCARTKLDEFGARQLRDRTTVCDVTELERLGIEFEIERQFSYYDKSVKP